MCKLSVIVPIYNVERFLRQCVDSIVNQTFRDLEIILVDDGSPDNCGAICDEYAARDARIKVIHKENGGLVTALNAGLAQATGEWVAFCDADDWVDTDYFEHMLSTIKPDIAPDIHFAQGFYMESPGGTAAEVHVYRAPFEALMADQIRVLLVRTLTDCRSGNERLLANGFYWNKLYRREFLQYNDLRFATNIIAKIPRFDCLFNFQALCKAARVTGGGIVGYRYRQVNGSAVHRYNRYTIGICVEFLHEISKLAQEYGMTADLQQAVYANAIWGFAGCLKSVFHPANTDSEAQKASKIKALKADPIVHEAIWNRSNQYLSYKRLLLKYALRLPWIWPLKILYSLNNTDQKRKNSDLY